MKLKLWIYLCIFPLVPLGIWFSTAQGFPTYSQGKVINPDGEEESFGNCKTCHGNFRDPDYISPTDGKYWSVIYEGEEETGLHDIHRLVMLDKVGGSRCRVCHTGAPPFYPVRLNSSSTTDFIPAISCMGCHGRIEDDSVGNPSLLGGLGAGLRQHHTNVGVKECMTCHADANPEKYIPVEESVLPLYYSTPDPVFPNKPTDPCNNPHKTEDYAGGPLGLDNDGDGKYDSQDIDCNPRGR